MSHPILSTSQYYTTHHFDVVGTCYVPEHHADDFGKASLCLRDTHVSGGALRALCARLAGIVVIANPANQGRLN